MLYPIWVLAALLTRGNCETTAPTGAEAEVSTWNSGGLTFPFHNSSCPLPIDDVSVESGGGFTPWSHAPFCAEWQAKGTPEGWANPVVKYCVYTSAAFRGNHGISVITTPELAASMSVGLDDAVVPLHIRDHATSSMNSFGGGELVFGISELPGRGLGTMARHKIRKWTTIVAGYPAILARMDFMEVLEEKDVREVLSRAVGQLPQEQQENIFTLARSTGGGVLQDILKTNIFGVEIEGVLHMALIPEGSRINHGCRPNAFWRYNPNTLAIEMIAMRDINRGEEITFTYAPLGLTYEGRQNVLRDWGFECKCDLCTSSPKEIKNSDQRRDRIHTIHNLLGKGEGLTSKTISRLSEEWMKLVDLESLWPQKTVYYEVIARAYFEEAKDFEKAEEYVDMCEELWIAYGGVKHDNLEGVKQLRHDFEMAKLVAEALEEAGR